MQTLLNLPILDALTSHDGLFPKKEVAIRNNFDNLQLHVKKFTIYNTSASYKQGVP
jgi:hypothetical protein